MFGTYERFDLVRASYARCASNTVLFEAPERPGLLRLSNNWTGAAPNSTDFAFDVLLTVNGVPVKYTYFADAGSLRLTAACGAWAEVALTDRSLTRLRGKNAGLRLELRSAAGNGARACRGVFARPDGCGWEGEFGSFGKLFFRPLSGSVCVTAPFDWDKNEYSLLRVDLTPDAGTDGFDAAIHDYRDAILPWGGYEPFDALVENNRAEFEDFCKKYRAPAPGYEEMAKYAQWQIWSCKTKAIGTFKDSHILFQNTWSCAAAPWQQSYNAMAMLADPAEAWRLIRLMFLYQEEATGRVPNMITYSTFPMGGMQPAFQGFALDYLIRKLGDGFISPEDAEDMLPKMAAWAEYWVKYRGTGRGDDTIALLSPHESGWDDSSMFRDGFPTEEPNSMAFLVLLMEAVALLARKCGREEEHDRWMARSKRLTDVLVTEYWDGEKFAPRVRGKAVDSMSLACYQPIILGKRLPQEIIDTVASKLTEEGQWLTEIGLASENVHSPLATYGVSFVCGRVVGPMNMILSVGLQAAGKQREAELIARRYCDHTRREGVILGYAPYNVYKSTGEKADQQIPPHPMDGWGWSSWSANCFLTMVTGVIGA